jgi:hypothetical protein
MATAYRLEGSYNIFIRMDWPETFSDQHVAYVRDGEDLWELMNMYPSGPGTLQIIDQRFTFERILLRLSHRALTIDIYDKAMDISLHSERLLFHQSFFLPCLDLAKAEGIPPWIIGRYEKAGLIAVFTHVYNEDDMLTMWEAHYAKLTAPEHLYVLDHGSQSSPRALLTQATNVVPIPRGMLDSWNISQFCAYFQRFLLTQYKWVIHGNCSPRFGERPGW